MMDPRLIAFHLPQFHPIPENDLWWGKGFTEWNNVVKGRPLFSGHYQPHLPADLGFYDLRLPETRMAQAQLAADHGIHGFCYYHYWFHGRQLLERPVNDIVASGEPDFPFCLCWANENWTRRWDGHDAEVLMAQTYSEEDDRRHLEWLAPRFADGRYIRVHGKPLFLVYRARKLPDALRTTTAWRERAQQLGIGDLYLCRLEIYPDDREDPARLGFDAAVEFQPDWVTLGAPLRREARWGYARTLGLTDDLYQRHSIFDYGTLVERMLRKPLAPYRRFPCVTPMWDNAPRRQNYASIVHGSTPELYERWLRETIERFVPPSPEENLVFINAWNEWAEGNHLEPCQRWGRSYLDATRAVVSATREGLPSRHLPDLDGILGERGEKQMPSPRVPADVGRLGQTVGDEG